MAQRAAGLLERLARVRHAFGGLHTRSLHGRLVTTSMYVAVDMSIFLCITGCAKASSARGPVRAGEPSASEPSRVSAAEAPDATARSRSSAVARTQQQAERLPSAVYEVPSSAVNPSAHASPPASVLIASLPCDLLAERPPSQRSLLHPVATNVSGVSEGLRSALGLAPWLTTLLSDSEQRRIG